MSAFVRTCETEVAAPPEEVFAYVADVARHPEWADQAMTVEHIGGPTSGPGATFRTHVVIDMPVGSQKDDATVTVVEVDAPRHLAYEAVDGSGRYRWTIDLTGDAGGTHVVQRVERLDAPIWMRAIQPMLWRAMGGRMVSNGLANIKAQVEARP